MYVKVSNNSVVKYPYTLREMREENTNVCFPDLIPDEDLALFGVYRVDVNTIPTYDNVNQRVEWPTIPSLVDGKWVLVGQVIDKTQEQLDSDTLSQAKLIRNERRELLKDSDWTQMSDSPLSSPEKVVWATYRQELRDVSDQSGFPWDVVWPVAPTE